MAFGLEHAYRSSTNLGGYPVYQDLGLVVDPFGVIITPLMPLIPGHKLGPYEVIARLGACGMGQVYRARDTRLERTVAIKILPSEVSNDPLRKQCFKREAKTISHLNHPHICVLHDVSVGTAMRPMTEESLRAMTGEQSANE